MHLQPVNQLTAVPTHATSGVTLLSHGAVGSPARLTVLMYLYNRPAGATAACLSQVVGLSRADTQLVLRALSAHHRLACDRSGRDSIWYVPLARAKPAQCAGTTRQQPEGWQ